MNKKDNKTVARKDKPEKLHNTRHGKPKILIAEDDPGIGDIFEIIFTEAGYSVEIKCNGSDLIESNFELPDLFLIDKQLPGASGLEVCRHLKSNKETMHIPVILASAAPDLNLIYQEAGADGYIKKPFDITKLLEIVNRHIIK